MSNNSKLRGLTYGFYRSRSALMHGLTDVYLPSINRRKGKLIELLREKAETASKSEVARKMRVAKGFYTLELSLPGGKEVEQIKADLALAREFISSGCYKYLTVKQAWLLFLVGLEISLWFYLGETIGKMHIVGYKV